jgi:hypothetical protein
MEVASEITNGIAKAEAGDEPMQRHEITTTNTAGMTTEVAINQGDAKRRMSFLAVLVHRTTARRELASLADEHPALGQVLLR